VNFPGPISLPSWPVFDQAKALSFLLSSFNFLLFYNSQQSCLVFADCYGCSLNLGALVCSFSHRKLVHASQIITTHLIHLLC
jgi:hypothetical protein